MRKVIIFILVLGCGDIDIVTESNIAMKTVSIQKIKSLYFNPSVYNKWGGFLGNTYLQAYFDEGVRKQVKNELHSVKYNTRATDIVVFLSAFKHFDWPIPQDDMIDKLAALINDANDLDLRVIVGIGHPYIVSKSKLKNTSKEPVCGHNKGEVINGYYLWWDIPDCPENNIDEANLWYQIIIDGLEDRISYTNGIRYIMLMGHFAVPFATEINMFHDDDPYLKEAQEYLDGVATYLSGVSDFPLGVALLPINIDPNRPKQEDSLIINVLSVTNFEEIQYIDLTWSPNLDINDLEGFDRYLETNSGNFVFSDGKFILFSMSLENLITYNFNLVDEHDLGGFWLWLYRDEQNFTGLRSNNGWRIPATTVFREYQYIETYGYVFH
ncbi:MAG: hypothetical protein O6943_06070 [Bacteroidetes bacterium]|nr:hypothetical protein [Bacteroidota bacterium]